MRAIDVMTPNVITVDPDTLVQDLAKLLSERNISGAPVVDKTGGIVGIVSEGDLLHRSELGTERHTQKRRAWWLEHFASELARDYVKSHGRTVKDIMTRDVATVSEDTELADIATLLETKRIKRVPVLRDGKIVGIVSRANLVRALAAATTERPAAPTRTIARSAPGSSRNWRSNHGQPSSGRRMSSSTTASCIYGLARTSPKSGVKPRGSRQKTFRACEASMSTKCPSR